jgi:hypothetical protein
LFQKIYNEVKTSGITYCVGDLSLDIIKEKANNNEAIGGQTSEINFNVSIKNTIGGTICFNSNQYDKPGVTGLTAVTIFHEFAHAGQNIFDFDNKTTNYKSIAMSEVEVRVIILFNYYKLAAINLRHDYDYFHTYILTYLASESDYEPFFGIFGKSWPFKQPNYYNKSSEDIFEIVTSYFDYILNTNTNFNYDPSDFKIFLNEYSRWLYQHGYKQCTLSDFENYDGTTPYFNHLTR